MKKWIYRTFSELGVSRLMRRLHRYDLRIITYHGFTDCERGSDIENFGGLHLHVDAFRQHLEYLHRYFKVISLESALDTLERDHALPPHAAVITMDDGYRSNYRLAFPLLSEFSMPATIFLATDFVDDNQHLWTDRVEYAVNRAEEERLRALKHYTNVKLGPHDTTAARGGLLRKVKQTLKSIPQSQREARVSEIEEELGHALTRSEKVPAIYESLDWSEVEELLDSGLVSIGSHSASHFILTECEEDVIEREIRAARTIIEQRTGRDCPLFCYPNGTVSDFDARTQHAVRAAGHRCALTTVVGFNKPHADPYTLKRVGMNNEDTLGDFEMALCGVRRIVDGGGKRLRRLGLVN